MFQIALRRALITEFAVLLGFFSLVYVQMEGFSDDPGVGWHLETGDYVLQNLVVPKIDPFLASQTAMPWVSDQWGGDVILAALFNLAGYPLVYALLTAIFLITFFWIGLRSQIGVTGAGISSIIATLLAFKIAQIHFILRPVLFGFFFFSILTAIVTTADFKNSDFQKRYWYLPILFLFWANIHPTFVLGLILLTLFAICKGFKQRNYFVVLFLCAAATLINPYGIDLHRSILALGQSEYFMNLHMEWQSPNFKNIEGEIFEAICFSLCIAGFALRNRRLPLSLFGFLGILTFAHFGLQAVRMLPFFGIFAAPYFAAALADCGAALQEGRIWLGQRLGALFADEKLPQFKYAGSKLVWPLAVVVILSSVILAKIPLFYGDFGPQKTKYPYAATEFILKDPQMPALITVVASPDWGGFLARYGEGRIKPIIDDRNTLLGEQAYKSFYAALKASGDYKQLLESFNTRYLLLPPQSELAYRLRKNPEVKVLFEDTISILFLV